jgi:hypothetical protein
MESRQRFVGGMRGPRLSRLEPGANATWPLVELTLENGRGFVRLRLPGLHRLVQRWLPSFEFDPRSVKVEEHDGLFSRGVRIERPGEPSVIFWTSQPKDVLAAIARQSTGSN